MKKTLLTVLGFGLACLVFAHEYILLAAKYKVKRGEDLELRLFVSDGFNIEAERPFQPVPTRRFELITALGTTDLSTTAEGAIPLVKRAVDFDGGGLFRLERDYARIALPTAKFLEYLKTDHMEEILPLVVKTKQEQKERYTRYIKCLVQSGESYEDTVYKRVTGQEFEIVLLQNPYTLNRNGLLRARVFFKGSPLAGKVITARNRTGSEPAIALTARTDAAGICSFRLSRKGEWFLHATHMIPCPDQNDSDWESFWTSYSFALE
ncbi:MAG TPA: DUF4198 domain-containing protein [Flavisolibacter sp.]|nr:DUF4198 domain-containing protein [Flavisolibacter sp.]